MSGARAPLGLLSLSRPGSLVFFSTAYVDPIHEIVTLLLQLDYYPRPFVPARRFATCRFSAFPTSDNHFRG